MRVASLGLTDREIPGVAMISDADALQELLARVGERLLDRAYLRYKPGTSLVAALQLASGPAFAYAVSDRAQVKLAKTSERAPAGSVVRESAAERLLIARPAADRDLPGLADPARWARSLSERSAPDLRMLAYKPHRRWVGSWVGQRGAGPHSVVRVCRRADLPAVLAGWRLAACVAEHDLGIAVPRLHARSDRYGVAVVSWLPGAPLDRLLGPASGAERVVPDHEVLAAVGAGLARFHAAARRGEPHRPVERVRAAEAVAQEVSAVLPGEQGRVTRLVRQLAEAAPRTHAVHPVHGDFSTDQVIIDPDGRVGFTDWDRAGWDDPAGDLGSLRAAGLPEDAYEVMLDGYRTVREPPETLPWHLAAALVGRLTEPLRRCRLGWREEIADRLATLESRLSGLRP